MSSPDLVKGYLCILIRALINQFFERRRYAKSREDLRP